MGSQELFDKEAITGLFCYDAVMNTFALWENDSFTIITPKNPHVPYTEGPHIIVAPKREVPNAWTDVELSASSFRLASKVCQVMEKMHFAPWFTKTYQNEPMPESDRIALAEALKSSVIDLIS